MMPRTMVAVFVCLVVVVCGSAASSAANSAPVVSNVMAVQRTGTSQMVDITYNLADVDGDLCMVWVAASRDGGATWDVPCLRVTGDWGPGVLPGTGKQITWDAGSDMPGAVLNVRFRICAEDGKGPAPKVMVPGGVFPYQNSTTTFVGSFLIDRYEVTNTFYCQFLNAADPTSAHWDSRMKIARVGSPGSYIYVALLDTTNHPVTYVSGYDAEAFATWRSQVEGATYRLPTEEEWEKAAAWDPVLGKYYVYGFQRDEIDPAWCNCVTGGTTRIGSFNGTPPLMDAKSYYGCYDMSGNVWERTAGTEGLFRGGAYDTGPEGCNCLVRGGGGWGPAWRWPNVGFRLVQVSP